MKTIEAKGMDDEGFWLILCPKEKSEVPVYHCAGSFVKCKKICDHVRIVSMGIEKAYVRCLYPEKREGT